MLVTVKEPDSLVVALRSVPVASFRTVTVAFGITEPLGSFTKPVIDPRSDWANKAIDASATKSAARMNQAFFIDFPLDSTRLRVDRDSGCSWTESMILMGMNFLFKLMLRNRKPLQKLQLSATLLLYMRTPMGVF